VKRMYRSQRSPGPVSRALGVALACVFVATGCNICMGGKVGGCLFGDDENDRKPPREPFTVITSTSATTTTATAASVSSTSGGAVFPPDVTRPRIMIVGDSISAGPGCYKKYLVENLTENGISNYEFVGEYTDDCGGGVRHSAVSCTTSEDYTLDKFTVPNCHGSESFPGMFPLVQKHNPDMVMIQLGVNDVWDGSTPISPILGNYSLLIAQARAHNPDIVVVVAQIHRIITDNCQNASSTTKAEELVMAMPHWGESMTTPASPVLIADLWTNSDAHEADDCVHPNDAGARRMGRNWYNALASILR